MSSEISEYLPLAAGVMISPMPIIGMLVLCIVGRAKTSGLAFLVGWFLGAFGLLFITVYFRSDAPATSSAPPSTFTIIFQFVLAFLMLYLAFSSWKNRPKKSDKIKEPVWITKLTQLSTILVFGVGIFMVVANIKNLPIFASAALIIGNAKTSSASALINVLIFSIVASLGMALPWVITVFGGESVKARLESARDWLYEYNNVIMAVLFLFLGVSTLGKAIGYVT